MTKRIWELDALRGLCICGMVAVHLVDQLDAARFLSVQPPAWFFLIKNWGGVLFFLISGICATLSRHSLRRGMIVFGAGMLITAVTGGMYLMDLAPRSFVISFGVLHCLGLCMLLHPLINRLSPGLLLLCASLLVSIGLLLPHISVQSSLLFWVGLVPAWYAAPDYFPLLPFWGFFLVGTVLGRRFYAGKVSLFPDSWAQLPLVRLLLRCGRHSLPIYLLHQPVLVLVLQLLPL